MGVVTKVTDLSAERKRRRPDPEPVLDQILRELGPRKALVIDSLGRVVDVLDRR